MNNLASNSWALAVRGVIQRLASRWISRRGLARVRRGSQQRKGKSRWRVGFHYGLLAGAVIITGCGNRQANDTSSGAEAENSTPETSSAGTEEGTEGDPLCEEGLTFCDGECIDTQGNVNHCGACGHVCNEEDGTGFCEDAKCTSVWSGCIDMSTGVADCDAYCSSVGQECGSSIEPSSHPCHGAFLWFEGICAGTQHVFSDMDDPSKACTFPLDFGSVVDADVMMSARCCCTQE